MIIVCELSFDDGAHVPFNAGLLDTIQTAFPGEKITVFGASGHIAELSKEVRGLCPGSIVWREIHPPTPGTKYIKRFLREFSILRLALKTYPDHEISRIVLTSAYPSTVLALKIVRWFCSRRIPFQIVLHGLSGVVGKRYRHPIRRFQDMKTALSVWGNDNIQYVVLEKPIRDTVVNNLPQLRDKVETFDHPISSSEARFQSIELSEPIRFGFLGLADHAKGFPVFLDLAKHITARQGKRAEFHVIGRFPQGTVQMDGIEVLATKPGTTLVSRQDYVQRVKPLHFIVLPHNAGFYALTASGVLLDAIAWQKPVVARKIPIFEAMFDRHGDIGYLFSTDGELKSIVEHIVAAADRERYRSQIMNLRDARDCRAPEALAIAYRETCRRKEIGREANRSFGRLFAR